MTRLGFGIVGTVALIAVATSCVKKVGDDCETRRTCGGGGGGIGNGGTSTGGLGGTTSGGGGTANTGGLAGGASCGTCSAPTPVCDTSSNTCVGCVASTDCSDPTPACDTATHKCVGCVINDDCGGTTPLCDTATQKCVECLTSTNCTNATKARCDAGQCKACTGNADCGHIDGKTVCETSSGTCFECTGTDYSSCGVDQATSTPLVCDSANHTCTTTKEHSSDLCQPCVSDAQCNAGKLCVLDTFGSPAQDVGYFCHWKQGDTSNGAPTDCVTEGRPYAKSLANAESIDGVTATVCVLAVSTCLANNDYFNTNCAPTGTPDDSLCGFDAPNDAKCIAFSSGFRCTMTCRGTDDCPDISAITCNTGTRLCNLQ